MIRTKAQRAEDRKKRDEQWAAHLRKKQMHPTKLRTGRNRPGHQDFSPVEVSYREVNDGNND